MVLGKKVAIFVWNGTEIQPLEKGRKCPFYGPKSEAKAGNFFTMTVKVNLFFFYLKPFACRVILHTFCHLLMTFFKSTFSNVSRANSVSNGLQRLSADEASPLTRKE